MPENNFKLSFEQFFLLLVALLFFATLGYMAYLIFTRVPEGYSAVYFPQNPAPQTHIQLNQEFPVEFFIENHQNKTIQYHYTIFLDQEKRVEKTVELKSSQIQKISEPITISDSFSGKKKLLIRVFPIDLNSGGFEKNPFELWVWVDEKN